MTADEAPQITAVLSGGPLSGTNASVDAVEGRPPKTIDVDGPGDGRSRYGLSGWTQAGHSAQYEYLYEI